MGSAIFIRVVSEPYASRGTELTRTTPFPALRVARAIAVLRFPLVLMILTIAFASLELCSEERAHCSEGDVVRVIQAVHVYLFGHFHFLAGKLDRDTDVALDPLHGVNAAGALVGEH